MNWKRTSFAAVFFLASALAAVGVIELVLQAVSRYGGSMEAGVVDALRSYTEESFSWERYFVDNYDRGVLVYEGLHRAHPTRGWALKPSLSKRRRRIRFTTNSDGFRGLADFSVDPERYGVVILGDSFTFGDNTDDASTWPNLLQERDPRLNVFNLGGSGYAVDQMLITLREEIERLRPQLVIAAFIDEDLRRSLLSFRDFKKPRFELHDGELVLTHTPIGNVDDVYLEARSKLDERRSPLQLVNVFNRLRESFRDEGGVILDERRCDDACLALNTKLFEEMGELAEANRAEFLMLYLPWGEQIGSDIPPSITETFFTAYQANHQNHFLNPRPAFLRATFDKAPSHYRRAENRLVSRLVYREIKRLPSWKRFKLAGHRPGGDDFFLIQK